MRLFRFFILSALLLANSCSDSREDLLIDDQTYQNMFVEFAIINHLDELLLRDKSIDELVNRVYDHYGVTEEQFRHTHDYFETNISEQLLRMGKILVRLREEREMISEAVENHERENRESVDSLRQRILNR